MILLPAILVVEDEAVIRMVTADVLQDAGFRIIEAVSADEALDLLDARPDVRVIVTDVNMTGSMDGLAPIIESDQANPYLVEFVLVVKCERQAVRYFKHRGELHPVGRRKLIVAWYSERLTCFDAQRTIVEIVVDAPF